MCETAVHATAQLIGQLLEDDPSRYRDAIDDMNNLRINEPPSWGFSVQHVESVQSMQENLSTLAVIATFLAAVQAQVITYSIQSNSTDLQVAVNALFFTGLLLDVFGGCVAYAVAVQLQHIYSVLLRRAAAASQISSALSDYRALPDADASTMAVIKQFAPVARHVRALEIVFLMSLSNRSAWNTTLSKVQRCHHVLHETVRALENVLKDTRLRAQVYMDLHVYRNTASELDRRRSQLTIAIPSVTVIRGVVFSGVLCLVVGILCYLESQQPLGVWITAFVSLGALLSIFVWLFLYSLRT